MNPAELFLADGRSAAVWYCGDCRTVSREQAGAEKCCKPYACRVCGVGFAKGEHRLICHPCFDTEQAAKEAARFEKAEKITRYDDPVWLPNSDNWYDSVGAMWDDLDPGELPAYVWTSNVRPVCVLDYESIVEHATSDAYEDFESGSLNGADDLEAALKVFNEANASIRQWEPNYKIAVVPGETGWSGEAITEEDLTKTSRGRPDDPLTKIESKCESCKSPSDHLSGCEACGRMFGPCCANAVDSNYCEGCGPD